MNFLEWLLLPLTDILQDKDCNLEPINPPEIELDETKYNFYLEDGTPCNKQGVPIPTETVSKTNSYIFRPQTFSDYIGQTETKLILQNFIEGTLQRKLVFPHTLIHGGAGCGKTTLVKIVSNKLNVPIIETITSDITSFDILKKHIHSVNGGIIFLDEIHSMDRNSAEKLYTIMEDFTYNGQSIEPFTLIGATTELGEIIENRRPFYDRFKIIVGLQDYTEIELATIIKQYKEKIFPADRINIDIYLLIAKNSRGTPRTAIRLLEATVYFGGNITKVLESFNIIKNGYTKTDIKLLQYLTSNGTTVGMQSISTYLDTSNANYLFSIEPYLLKTGVIMRTPRGRRITTLGQQLLKELGV